MIGHRDNSTNSLEAVAVSAEDRYGSYMNNINMLYVYYITYVYTKCIHIYIFTYYICVRTYVCNKRNMHIISKYPSQHSNLTNLPKTHHESGAFRNLYRFKVLSNHTSPGMFKIFGLKLPSLDWTLARHCPDKTPYLKAVASNTGSQII